MYRQPFYDNPPDDFPEPPLYDEPPDDYPSPPPRNDNNFHESYEEEEEDPYEEVGRKFIADVPIEGYVEYTYEIGSKGRNPCQFGGWIQHYAISEDGYTLYACDVFNKRIQIISLPDRKCIHSFTTTMPQYDFQARGISVLRGGNICVNCVGFDGTSRIGIFTKEGQLIRHFGQGEIGSSSAITVDSMDRISVVDRRKMTILTLSKNGKKLGAFSNPVKQDCLRICANSRGDLLIPDHLNNAVWYCDEHGNIKGKLKPPGGPAAGFMYPAGVAVDSHDNIFICDVGNHSIAKFGQDGEYCRRVLTKADNSIWRPHDIVISKRGQVLISEVNKTYIKLFGYTSQ
ncbi:uncharacterized protein LOC120342366 [Styela clava]